MLPLAMVVLQTQTVPLSPFQDDGGTKMAGMAAPILLPIVGGAATAPFGTKGVRVWVSGGSLTVDRNGNGKPDANERIVLQRQDIKAPDGKPVAVYLGSISLSPTVRYLARYLVSETHAAGFDKIRNKLALMPAFGYLGTARLGGKKVRIGLRGADLAHTLLVIDRNGDGRLGDVPAEGYSLGKPFSLDGTTYRASAFSISGKPSVTFAASSTKVAEVPMPADLSVGKIAPPIPGKTLGGTAVTFPKSFANKVVLLDVWATWCGPCKGEIPFMREAYAKYKRRGFEICSMSIDDPGTQANVAAFTRDNGMAWTQVFQGRGWGSFVCRRYNITGIPFMMLVDGSSGKILAREDRLRGGALAPTLEGVLSMRGR